MENPKGSQTPTKPRLIVLETSDLDQRGYSSSRPEVSRRRRKGRSQHKQAPVVNEECRALPLEIGPVLDAIIAYGRKTNSLGELNAAAILEDIADGLDQMGALTPALQELKLRAKSQATAIKSKFERSYEEVAAQ